MTYTLKESERTASAMIYSPMRLCWGKLVHPMGIRPQTWLKMTLVPEYFIVLDANMLIFGGQQPARLSTTETYLPVAQIIAFHLVPPFEFEPDYDPDTPNREMKSLTINADIFRFDGNCRVSTIAEFAFSIQGGGKSFRSLYDVKISHPTAPSIKPIQVPHALVRMDHISYLLNE